MGRMGVPTIQDKLRALREVVGIETVAINEIVDLREKLSDGETLNLVSQIKGMVAQQSVFQAHSLLLTYR